MLGNEETLGNARKKCWIKSIDFDQENEGKKSEETVGNGLKKKVKVCIL